MKYYKINLNSFGEPIDAILIAVPEVYEDYVVHKNVEYAKEYAVMQEDKIKAFTEYLEKGGFNVFSVAEINVNL